MATPEDEAVAVPAAGDPTDDEILDKVRAGGRDTPAAIDQLVARGQRRRVVAVLRERLRGEGGIG